MRVTIRYAISLLTFSRFGLYGNPLDPELFDMELPPILKLSTGGANNPSSYARVVAGTVNANNGPTIAVFDGPDDQDFRDLLSQAVSTSDKSGSTSSSSSSTAKANADTLTRNVCGLLEVEPLHFTCHSTSDATKLEKADIGKRS